MKTSYKVIIGLLSAGVIGTGIYLWNQYQVLYKAINDAFTKKPSIGKLNDISLTNIDIVLVYNISNQGILSAVVTNQNYDVTINGKSVSSIKNNTPVNLKAKGISQFPLTVVLNPENLLKIGFNNLKSILVPSERKNFVIRIKGSFSYNAGILSGKNYPLDITFTLADLTTTTPAPTS
jgi:LEA14-like dessication related protein